jgi:hypothetical protein
MILPNFQICARPTTENQTQSGGLRLQNDCAVSESSSAAGAPGRSPSRVAKFVPALLQLLSGHSYQSGGNTL